MTLNLPNGYVVLVRCIPLHRRKPFSRVPYMKPSDWLATAGSAFAWGRTRRQAVERLRDQLARAAS
jgi:hypothetical protein